jgi:Glycosyl hydrolase family 10
MSRFQWDSGLIDFDAPRPAAVPRVSQVHGLERQRHLQKSAQPGNRILVVVSAATNRKHDFIDILGKHAMVDWFRAARAGDPHTELFINDFTILEGEVKAHQHDYAATIQYLIDQGAPFDGIGLQSHFPVCLTPWTNCSSDSTGTRRLRKIWRSRNSISTRWTRRCKPITRAIS